MMRATRGLLALAILLLGAACAGGAATAGSASNAETGSAGRARTRSDLITLEEIQQRGQFSNLYELVQTLRPRWLRTQGPDSFSSPGEVQVHMDGNRLGSINALKGLSPSGVTSLQWLNPIDAAARYGLDHGHGAIIVSTRPVH
jgi:hypothetical protein